MNIELNKLTGDIKKKFEQLKNPELLLRPVVVDLLTLVKQRIHIEGKASDGEPIGTYSPAYMKVRTGKLKAAYSKGKNKGKPRPQFKRKPDTKVIVSLTTKLENDWAVMETSDGKGYGLGFLTDLSFKKMGWVEEVKKRTIAEMTPREIEFAQLRFNEIVNGIMSS